MFHAGRWLFAALPCLLAAGLPACTSPDRPDDTSATVAMDRRASENLPVAIANDGRLGAGRWQGDTLTLSLRIVATRWLPEGPDGPAVPAWAFAADDGPPMVPGPMLDVAVGTPVRVSLVNTLDSAIAVHGLDGEPMGGTPRVLAPGARDTVRFVATTPGTHFYWGAPPGVALNDRGYEEGQLNGALIVRALGDSRPADERVLLISESFRFDGDEVLSQLAINGLSWPHTERLEFPQGDSVHFRVINATVLQHPMHLHGFYYRVTRRGRPGASEEVPPLRQALVVTDVLAPGHTHDIAFLPSEPGGWIYHCHVSSHTSGVASHDPAIREHERHGSHPANGRHMAGLVMGLRVTSSTPLADRGAPQRRLRLYVQARDSGFVHGGRRYMYAWREGEAPAPPRDTLMRVSPLLVLARDERVAVTIVNRLAEPTAVHWHGLEIESASDGVPHVSGHGAHPVPPIPAGDSITVTFTPPRAGTFMYHAHFSEMHQINGGLYGALVVTEDGTHTLPVSDHVLSIGGGGPNTETLGFESPHALVNGSRFPEAIEAVRGTTHRLRLTSMHVDWPIRVTLAGRDGLLAWRRVAKDGAPLPPSLAEVQPAWWDAGPGETLDVEVTFTTVGEYVLEVRTQSPGWYIPVVVRVVDE